MHNFILFIRRHVIINVFSVCYYCILVLDFPVLHFSWPGLMSESMPIPTLWEPLLSLPGMFFSTSLGNILTHSSNWYSPHFHVLRSPTDTFMLAQKITHNAVRWHYCLDGLGVSSIYLGRLQRTYRQTTAGVLNAAYLSRTEQTI